MVHLNHLRGKELTLVLYNQVRKYLVKDFTIEGNTILFTYYGKDQCDLGVYGVTLYENKCKENMFTVDFDEAFKLVSNSSEVTYTEPDYGDLEVIVLEGTSDIMVPDYSNVVKISDVSDDPIENDHGKVASTVATFKLNSLIEEESDRAKSQEGILLQSIEAEKTRAEEAEKQLQQNIDAENERAINAESGIQQEIEAEVTRATKAETTLAGAIVQESDRAKGEEVKFSKLMLTKGNKPALSWAPSPNDVATKEYVDSVKSLIIPLAVLDLTDSSSTDEILSAFGGLEVFASAINSVSNSKNLVFSNPNTRAVPITTFYGSGQFRFVVQYSSTFKMYTFNVSSGSPTSLSIKSYSGSFS